MSPVLEAAAAVTLILGCLTAVGVMLRRLWLGLRKAVHVIDLVQTQLTPNGGGSMNDRVRIAAEEAVKAREKAEQVAIDLMVFRELQSEDSAATTAAMDRVQHDVTNIRTGQKLLLGAQQKTDERVTDHRDRNAEAVRRLQTAVDDLVDESRARDKALGAALVESLDVAIAASDPEENP